VIPITNIHISLGLSIESLWPEIMFGVRLMVMGMEVYGYTLEIPMKAILHLHPNQFTSVPKNNSWSFAPN
jgi:hypothetical protein